MDLKRQNDLHAQDAKRKIQKQKRSTLDDVFISLWSWVDGVANASRSIFGNIAVMAKIISFNWSFLFRMWRDVIDLSLRLPVYIEDRYIRPLFWYTVKRFNRVEQRIRGNQSYLIRLIYVVSQYVLARCMDAIRAERIAREHAVGDAEKRARLEIRYTHQTIEREAASGYRLDYGSRIGLIEDVLDYLVEREPLVKDAVNIVVKGLLDLIGVDDPIARIALGFAIKEIIDRMGIDKAVGDLAGDLINTILGDPHPRNLHDVVADICSRLDTSEQQWATFFEDGGSQVEQAGEQWRGITSMAADVAILGFAGLAVADPDAWAASINDTIGEAANLIADGMADLIRGA